MKKSKKNFIANTSSSSLDLDQAKVRIEELRRSILYHDNLYYQQDRPEISDFEYDGLYRELLDLESQFPQLLSLDSPTQRTPGQPMEGFEKAPHTHPMLSLQNTYSPAEIAEFLERLKKTLKMNLIPEIFCEPKLDGLAIELVYENGVLIRALTRGDGAVGENVISNIRTLRDVPLRLKTQSPPALLEVRGEVLIFKDDFAELNETQQANGDLPFANPRNAAAGAVRQLDPKICAQRPLRMICYSPASQSDVPCQSQAEFLQWINDLGLPSFPISKSVSEQSLKKMLKEKSPRYLPLGKLCSTQNEVTEYYQLLDSVRHELPFEIDGVVLKVNDFGLQKNLGSIARSPRWATAGKFSPSQAQTVVKEISVQVGRTGALTPVAIMDPVKVSGVTVSHATLHNQDEIARKDIRIGDTVIIQRAGDVIPEVVSVVLSQRLPDSQPYVIPSQCPACGTPGVRNPDEAVSRCPNARCQGRWKQALQHFVSRKAMNIEKLGEKIIDQLVDKKLVTRFSDIYQLNKESLSTLERMGDKSAENIVNSISKSSHTTLGKLIYALGFRFVGEQTAKSLASHFRTMEGFLSATEAGLLEIQDVGEKIAASLAEQLSDTKFVGEIQSLTTFLEIKEAKVISATNEAQVFSGMTFVITGTLPEDRDSVKDHIESLGGKVSNSVSKKTSVVIAGENAGSKLTKAEELKVPIVDWATYLDWKTKGSVSIPKIE